MKKTVMVLLSALFFFAGTTAYCAATVQLKTGTYKLKGNEEGIAQWPYTGKVYISPLGKNYKIDWLFDRIDNSSRESR
ncbi:MAG TPA: hypothetical protein VN457_04105, partial [Chlamydiales bacterium]|nr:hypothetical protein [Chlamydiales bacterium]